MSATPTSNLSLPPRKAQAPRPPRLAINPTATYIPGPNSGLPPFTAQTHRYGGSTAYTNNSMPYWPPVANPFVKSDFMSKGFEGFIDFTKTGMSFGEKFSFGMYNKFSKWSKKWFTHIFLFMVVILYSSLGALIFMTIEGSQAERNLAEERMARTAFLSEMRDVTSNLELLKLNKDEWNGRLIGILREHKDAIDTILNNNMTTAELEAQQNPWRFWNSMFYCGTVYTTIENYRKNSGDSAELIKLPQRTTQSFREPKRHESHQSEEKPSVRRTESNRRSKTFKDYESSTVSESDSENIRYRSPPRRINRGPPPTPPIAIPEDPVQTQPEETVADRRSLSRHPSLSPPRRRMSSKVSEEREIKVEKPSVEPECDKAEQPVLEIKEKPKKAGIFTRIFGKKELQDDQKYSDQRDETDQAVKIEKYSWKNFVKTIRWMRAEWIQFKHDYQRQIILIRLQRNRCFGNLIILAMLLGFGGLAFRFTEGNTDGVYKCEVKKVKRDFIDQLWLQSHSMREEDWKSNARNRLRTFEEELYTVYDTGASSSYTGQKAWGFINSIIYCWTVVTQIGYGHIAPKTTLGQAITIVYAIFGIPIFLILLADFGKLFTRGIKFVWAYVRRLYYTGTCRKVRKSQQMQDLMKGANTVYDVAIRRPSQFIRDQDIENLDKMEAEAAADTLPHTPTSPYPETLEIDDDFNLPVSVATVVLVLYIIVGAFVYPLWEVKWSYFEAFYFVFISMSTIGFGDYVPDHPIFMMLSTVYLVFGLALTSMFINVVQIKLSDSFRQASAKIGATIGFSMTEEELSKHSQLGTPIPPAALNNIPEEHDLEDREVRNITEGVPTHNLDVNAPPPLLPRQPRMPPPEEPKKKKKLFF